MRSPETQAGLRQPTASSRADRQRNAKVRNDGLALEQQDIGRFDVAVNHALAVGIVERLGHVGRNVDSVADRKLMLALKVLKPELAAVVGAERFLAEIRVTANLQHPNILPLHDSGEADGFLFYVMPYVEGDTLKDRLKREHQLPVGDAVHIASDMAEALDYAHRQGVIHRDIKPANVLLLEGKPVLADFGIALAVGAAGAGRLTETGLSLGTPHYMSPEQATGDQSVGPQTDTYALGCVLYEMLVGEPPYTGGTAQAVLGKIIAGKLASATEQRASVPANVAAAIGKALEKRPADRFTSAQDFVRALSDPGFRQTSDGALSAPTVGTPRPVWQRRTSVATIGLALLVGGVWLGSNLARSTPRLPVRLSLWLPASDQLVLGRQTLAISPNGETVVYAAVRDGIQQLYRRPIDQYAATPIPGTEGASVPFFSPDGLSLGFAIGRELWKTALGDGVPARVTEIASTIQTASWSDYDTIVFGINAYGRGLFEAPASGGEARPVTTVYVDRGELYHQGGERLPGTEALLLGVGPTGIAIQTLGTMEHTPLIAEGAWPDYLPSGHIVFQQGTTLFAVSFDVESLEMGEPASLVANLLGNPAVASNGTMVYMTGQRLFRQLVWVDRAGREVLLEADPGSYLDVDLSPDGNRVALTLGDPSGLDASDIWIYDVVRGNSTPLTVDPAVDVYPLWTRDGTRVVFSSTRNGTRNLFWRDANGIGSVDPLTPSPYTQSAWSWSPDGRLFISQDNPGTSFDIAIVSSEDGDSAEVLIQSPAGEYWADLSPDGNWLAFVSSRSGQTEVYVRPFPDVDSTEWTISTDGGGQPKWSLNSRELFYRDGSAVMAVVYDTEPTFSPGIPDTLFVGDYIYSTGRKSYDVAPDGRFLMMKPVGQTEGAGPPRINVVQDFFEELRRLVPN